MKFTLWIIGAASLALSSLVFQGRDQANSNFEVFLPTIGTSSSQPDDFTIPNASDWVDYGMIFTAGVEGAWDHLLYGGFSATAVKKNGTYFLYYQGAKDFSDQLGSVTQRAIGVATSSDGINFTKYDNNPVLTWSPNGNPEEGAVSSGATVVGEEIVLYFGANTMESPTTINADGRLTTSKDGITFVDKGIALDHEDPSLWGSGDELFPITAIHDAGRWLVYYLPNGSPQQRKLGVAWGDAPDALDQSEGVRSGLTPISAWGTAGHARIGPGKYAIFLNEVTDPRTEVRIMSTDYPDMLSEPVQVYRFDEVQQATVLLDEGTRTWFMYYRGISGYGVKLAPAGEPDTIPPSAPENVMATALDDRRVELSWDPAIDHETGIVQYRIYRDGIILATVNGQQFIDTAVTNLIKYRYTVLAVNYHGVEGEQSTSLTVATPASAAYIPIGKNSKNLAER